MNQALFVSVLQGDGSLTNVFAGLGVGERAKFLDHPREIRTMDEFHGDVRAPVGFVGIQQGDDVRVFQGCCRGDFPLVPAANDLVRHQMRPDDLQGDDLSRWAVHRTRPGVDGLVDLAHPAFADFIQHQIRPDQQLRDAIDTHFPGLIRGEQIGVAKGFRQAGAVVARTFQNRGEFCQLVLGIQSAMAKSRQQGLGRIGVHRLPGSGVHDTEGFLLNSSKRLQARFVILDCTSQSTVGLWKFAPIL